MDRFTDVLKGELIGGNKSVLDGFKSKRRLKVKVTIRILVSKGKDQSIDNRVKGLLGLLKIKLFLIFHIADKKSPYISVQFL